MVDKSQIGKVEDIEGIGKEYAKDLKKLGIKDTEDLRNASLVALCEKTGISTKLLYRWQCLSDLFRLKGAAEEYTDLLFAAEIETVKEVSKQKPKELLSRVIKVAEEMDKKPGWHGDVDKVPDMADVKTWIKSAKELTKGKDAIMAAKSKKMPALETKTPEKSQIGDIVDIEGIGPSYAKKLKAAGIKTTEDLRNAPLVAVVEETGISPKLIYKWICMSDLFRIRGAAEEYTDLIFYSGIETVKELTKYDEKELLRKMKKTAKESEKKGGWAGDIKKIPGEKTIRKWIESANDLV
jgi:predicted flap endonuclease-1-like 5' DNA nuclease